MSGALSSGYAQPSVSMAIALGPDYVPNNSTGSTQYFNLSPRQPQPLAHGKPAPNAEEQSWMLERKTESVAMVPAPPTTPPS